MASTHLRLASINNNDGVVFLKQRRGGEGPAPVADSGPTIFAALDQIGLKLEGRKMPMPVIVVDHVEPPSEN